MSILIRGMEMPRHGMVINIYADGRVSNHFDEFCETIATAVPVPKHGRLIDADALCDGLVSNHPVMIHANVAPTIIPADPSEEETE